MHTEPIYAVEALAAGASGYVLKSSAGDELVTAIRRVLEGHVYVAKAIAQSVNKASEARPKSGDRTTDWLTNRQREVLQLLAEGRQVKEIADHAQSVAQNRGVSQVPDYGHPCGSHGRWTGPLRSKARRRRINSSHFSRNIGCDGFNDCFHGVVYVVVVCFFTVPLFASVVTVVVL
jgi:hypothetical protein